MGNLSGALGTGWSVEDEFAWAVGANSELTLPLPDHDDALVLRFDVHPAIFPPKVALQRLTVCCGKTVLGSFGITRRDTLVIDLPVELTRGAERLNLTLFHPDATRPRDHLPNDDARRLALCFHSATLSGPGSYDAGSSSTHDAAMLEPVHGLIAGDVTAMRICEVIGKLPSLKGRFGIRFLNASQPLELGVKRLPPDTLATMQFCWLQLNAGTLEMRDSFRELLPAGCVLRTFHAPVIRSLWPFQTRDDRVLVEPGHKNSSLYPHADRLARALVGMNMPDDVVYLMYDMSAEQETLDLEGIFADDLRRWKAEGRTTNMQLADFIEDHIATNRVFIAPNRVGPALLREMVNQVLDDGQVRDIVRPETLSAELDTLLDGYAGWQEEIPVHKRVANHFKLSWWSPDMTYRWMNNVRTHRDYTIDTIRSVQWRP
jgi:hypothetical protein